MTVGGQGSPGAVHQRHHSDLVLPVVGLDRPRLCLAVALGAVALPGVALAAVALAAVALAAVALAAVALAAVALAAVALAAVALAAVALAAVALAAAPLVVLFVALGSVTASCRGAPGGQDLWYLTTCRFLRRERKR